MQQHHSPSPSSSLSLSSPSSSKSRQEQAMKMDHEGAGEGFGTLYYRSLLQGRGILFVDQQLTAGEETASWVRQYASDVSLFRRDFGKAMMKLPSTNVLTGASGNVKVLRWMRQLRLEDVVIGQYKGHSKGGKTHLGYIEDPTVPNDSLTPTFAAAALFIDNVGWDGVPFLMKAGKALNTRRGI
ncbi:hypothetical protein Ccrd_010483 [Cynara cardunculus var. scolymus]|uniref:Plant heme peroxidase family profile domain-containing protein n=1 Tax=Cynara cardunculus var. scolymus TaxID=59895 RepID=A0A103YL60_CYNCS|nr:hypothetical protein Ccrd_010483 [Cynara cardunculus var. scolymus]